MPPWTSCYAATSRPPAAATSRRSLERPGWPGRASTHEPTGRETNARGHISNTKLRERIQECDARIEELTQFKDRGLSQLAAQHQDILRLRRAADSPDNIHNLPTAQKAEGCRTT